MNLTPQQKLEILCAYLPHGVEVQSDKIYDGFRTKLVISNLTNTFVNGFTISSALDYDACPILRHPDDMTEEELMEACRIINYNYFNRERDMVLLYLQGSRDLYLNRREAVALYQYLYSIHIDTFGAIEAGWAIRKELN